MKKGQMLGLAWSSEARTGPSTSWCFDLRYGSHCHCLSLSTEASLPALSSSEPLSQCSPKELISSTYWRIGLADRLAAGVCRIQRPCQRCQTPIECDKVQQSQEAEVLLGDLSQEQSITLRFDSPVGL